MCYPEQGYSGRRIWGMMRLQTCGWRSRIARRRHQVSTKTWTCRERSQGQPHRLGGAGNAGTVRGHARRERPAAAEGLLGVRSQAGTSRVPDGIPAPARTLSSFSSFNRSACRLPRGARQSWMCRRPRRPRPASSSRWSRMRARPGLRMRIGARDLIGRALPIVARQAIWSNRVSGSPARTESSLNW